MYCRAAEGRRESVCDRRLQPVCNKRAWSSLVAVGSRGPASPSIVQCIPSLETAAPSSVSTRPAWVDPPWAFNLSNCRASRVAGAVAMMHGSTQLESYRDRPEADTTLLSRPVQCVETSVAHHCSVLLLFMAVTRRRPEPRGSENHVTYPLQFRGVARPSEKPGDHRP